MGQTSASGSGFLVQLFRHFAALTSELAYLKATSAPLAVYWCLIKTKLDRGNRRIYIRDRQQFQRITKDLRFSTDWFSWNIPYWLRTISGSKVANEPIEALEIGSWEGMSSFFILSALPKARLTCVDTWKGADEHQGQNGLDRIEAIFDENLGRFGDRLTKFKGRSFDFFQVPNKHKFDLIYIDGSHRCDDVMLDSIMGFQRLKVDGVMIFDDYFWRYFRRTLDNPAGAINTFLRLKAGQFALVAVYNQLIVRKISEDSGA